MRVVCVCERERECVCADVYGLSPTGAHRVVCRAHLTPAQTEVQLRGEIEGEQPCSHLQGLQQPLLHLQLQLRYPVLRLHHKVRGKREGGEGDC